MHCMYHPLSIPHRASIAIRQITCLSIASKSTNTISVVKLGIHPGHPSNFTIASKQHANNASNQWGKGEPVKVNYTNGGGNNDKDDKYGNYTDEANYINSMTISFLSPTFFASSSFCTHKNKHVWGSPTNDSTCEYDDDILWCKLIF